jgi:enoyl-CoA hydratase/carnithine racemase
MSDYKTIMLDKQGGVFWLTLNRPDKFNAVSAEMYSELALAIDEMERTAEFRVLVITGAGRAFCAGGDINELLQAGKSVEAAQERVKKSHRVAARWRMMRQPIIAAVNGDAVGAGCGLAMSADLRIASEKARFGLTFLKVGLAPDMGSVYNAVRLAGISKAMEMTLLSDIVDAREAERIGLVNKVVPSDQLTAIAREWAERLAKAPSLAVGLTKAALYKSQSMDFHAEIDDEANAQSICLNSSDAREGLAAFLEKRPPVFGKESRS